MRITGLATGLDMDEIVSSTMKAYRIKIDQKTQKKDIVEIKQQLYRDVMSDASKFYDKYFDITKSDSLLKPSNYKAVKFTSSTDSVKVTSSNEAKLSNYTITGNAATAAKAVIKDGVEEGGKVVINGEEFTLSGSTSRKMEENLNKQLKDKGINVTATFSEVAGSVGKPALVLEANEKGSSGKFYVGGGWKSLNKELGQDPLAATITGISLENIKKNGGKISIGGSDITLDTTNDDLLIGSFVEELKKRGFEATIEKDVNGNLKITSSSTKSENDPQIKVDNISATFTNGREGTPSKVAFTKNDLGSGNIVVNGKNVNIPEKVTDEELKKLLEESGVNAEINGDNIILTSKTIGSTGVVDVKIGDDKGKTYNNGKDSTIVIKDENTGETYEHKGTSNTVTLDGVTFTFSGKIDGEAKITGKNDVTELKDNIVKFINDYNTLIEKLNTVTSTRPNRNYSPLTADQKKEMSENEIKLWNEKVQQGQLYKDSNLTRIADSLKQSMRTLMNDSGLNLEKIGIVPVKDYSGTKNGTFSIDEDKLTKALEDNVEEVMNLFTKSAPKALSEDEKNDPAKVKKYNEEKNQTGILNKLKDILYSEFKSSSSPLAKKVGLQGTATFSNNELTKSISDYEKKIKDMERDFTKREQALYSKYATLEKMMSNLASQQLSLQSMFGA